MALALRNSDRELALVVRGKALLWHPERAKDPTYAVWWAAIEAEIKRLKLRVHTGWFADALPNRGLTLTRRDIYIGDGAEKADLTVRDLIFTEEVRHAFEMYFHAGNFQLLYATDPRFRWATEMQATAAILRWLKVMEARRVNMVKLAEKRAAAFAKPFPSYNLGRIKNLRAETVNLLVERVIDA